MVNDVDLGDWSLAGDATLLRSLATNLIGNAISYAGVRGAVYVAVEDGLTIENTGEPLALDFIERMGQPFRRGTRTPGVGLGLTIVNAVARAHGLTIYRTGRSGGGLVTRVLTATEVPR